MPAIQLSENDLSLSLMAVLTEIGRKPASVSCETLASSLALTLKDFPTGIIFPAHITVHVEIAATQNGSTLTLKPSAGLATPILNELIAKYAKDFVKNTGLGKFQLKMDHVLSLIPRFGGLSMTVRDIRIPAAPNSFSCIIDIKK